MPEHVRGARRCGLPWREFGPSDGGRRWAPSCSGVLQQRYHAACKR
jgi:hypothetical protein